MSDRARATDQARALGGLALAVLGIAALLVGGMAPFAFHRPEIHGPGRHRGITGTATDTAIERRGRVAAPVPGY